MLTSLLAVCFRWLLGLRYRVTISGLGSVRSKKGCLILANHPAQIDPAILCSHLWGRFKPRPIVLEKYYYMPSLQRLMRLLRAIPMPDMGQDAGPYKRKRIEKSLEMAARALAQGENVLLYPSGRLMRSGFERLGANSGVQSLLALYPDLKIVMVRSTGLYGSILSRAVSGAVSPDLGQVFRTALKALLFNLIFFTPRRHVQVVVEEAPAELRAKEGVAFNQALEEWFNELGEEKPRFISLSAWRERPAEAARVTLEEGELIEVPAQVLDKIKAKLSEVAAMALEKIDVRTKLSDELGLDSLSVAELVTWLDDEFGVTDVQMEELLTVGAVAQVAAGAIAELPDREIFSVPPRWTEESARRPAPFLPEGRTLSEAFLRCAEKMDGYYALGDRTANALEWGTFKIRVLVLAGLLKRYPGKNIGVLLPASGGALATTLACLLAGKVPVMINWTAGRRNIEHALESAGVSRVLTSRAFLDRVSADLEYLEERLVILEDLRMKIGIGRKLRGLLLALLGPRLLIRLTRARFEKPADTAVILFTSGSEATPKGVALTHENILSNIRAAMPSINFRSDDVLLGILPPFHSFGLTVCTFLPAVSGLKVAYYPNPNEARKLGAECEIWKASVVAGTPTFLKSIIRAAAPQQLRSVRLFISGAEKAPDDLFKMVDALGTGARVIEGYGITECSPIVCVNRPEKERLGVGEPIPGTEVIIISPENKELLQPGELGLVLIRGPGVFGGYLGGSPDPFLTVGGQRWYNSGDLGRLQEGRLVLAGRLKRFIKIAGEMISLPAIEECLQAKWPSLDGAPNLGVVALETPEGDRPPIILFSTMVVNESQANEALKEAGFPNLVRISRVVNIEAIPILGSGKVDIKELEEQARNIG